MSEMKGCLPSSDEEVAHETLMLPDGDPRGWDGTDRLIGRLLARILALRAEVAELRGWRHDALQKMVTDAEERTALRAEVEKLKQDAAQWKHLHDACHPSQEQLRAEVERLKAEQECEYAYTETCGYLERAVPCTACAARRLAISLSSGAESRA